MDKGTQHHALNLKKKLKSHEKAVTAPKAAAEK